MNVAWYVARAGGMLAFLLLTATVVIGLTMSSRVRLRRWPRFAVEDVHRFLGLLTWSFVGVHAVALIADTYLSFSIGDLLIPGVAPYRPLPTALGVVALELLAALALANLLRPRLSYTFWRRTHYLNFAVWLLVFVHGVTAGTDSDTLWGLALYTTCAGLVGGLTAWRVLNLPAKDASARSRREAGARPKEGRAVADA
jgi:methionine sulfoxide reductase heme-binding subunit